MLKATNMEFDYMLKDKVMAHVKVDYPKIDIVNFTDNLVLRPFGYREKVTMIDVCNFFKKRCMPETRAGKERILGGRAFDPYFLVEQTHGVMAHDLFWLRFKGENLTWDDVKLEGWHK